MWWKTSIPLGEVLQRVSPYTGLPQLSIVAAVPVGAVAAHLHRLQLCFILHCKYISNQSSNKSRLVNR